MRHFGGFGVAVVTAVVLFAWRHIDLRDAHARIETLVWQDTICDLANRRAFVAMIEAELVKPNPEPFVIFIDGPRQFQDHQ